VKQEDGHAVEPQFAGEATQPVDLLLHRIADDNHLGRFVYSLQCGDGYGPTDLELTTMQFYFHDAARTPFDETAPSVVADLSVAPAFGEAVLRWTAPADMGVTGRATAYDLRCSTAPITPANFASARPIATGIPDAAGRLECVRATGLTPCTAHWFAMRTRDEFNDWSGLSNVVSAITDCVPGPAADGCGNAPLVSAPDDLASRGRALAEAERESDHAFGQHVEVVGGIAEHVDLAVLGVALDATECRHARETRCGEAGEERRLRDDFRARGRADHPQRRFHFFQPVASLNRASSSSFMNTVCSLPG